MTCSNLFNRIVTAVALIALAVTLGIWLIRPPVTAATPAPANAPPPKVPAGVASEPKLPPLPLAIAVPTTIEVQVEAEVAPAARPAAESAEPKPEGHPACQPRRRGLFRRR